MLDSVSTFSTSLVPHCFNINISCHANDQKASLMHSGEVFFVAAFSFEIGTFLPLKEVSSLIKQQSKKEAGTSTPSTPFTHLRIYFILGIAV